MITRTESYLWKGKTSQSERCQGEFSANNVALVYAHLKQQHITPISVKKKPKDLFHVGRQIKHAHIAVFSHQLATLLKAGLPIAQSLQLMAEGLQKPLPLRHMILDLLQKVEEGQPFSRALVEYPKQFSPLYVALVRAGEEGGVLAESIDKLADSLEGMRRVKRKINKATRYPVSIVFVAFIVTGILLTQVIPVFESFFKDLGAELPWLTQWVVSISRSLRANGLILLALILGAVWLFIRLKNSHRKIQHLISRWRLKLPLLGPVFKLGAMSRFARTLSVLFEASVPLINALNLTAPATGESPYEKATTCIALAVEQGVPLHVAMQNTGLSEGFAIQLVRAGEASGNLGEMLSSVAKTHEEQLDEKISNLTTLLEPLVVSVLAIVVGTLVVAMYLPIFLLGEIVG